MASAAMPLAFGSLLAGLVIFDYGVKVLRSSFGDSAASGKSPAAGSAISGFPAAVNPLPGATGTRLDQGIDGTGRHFVSPWKGHVEVANANDPGWRGGGYIAIRSDDDPSKVYFLAEGITPIVKRGQFVRAGDKIAYPVRNPYNGIIGNFEAGLANPHNPLQPLAQVVSDAPGMVVEFSHWLAALGGPKPTSSDHAGRA